MKPINELFSDVCTVADNPLRDYDGYMAFRAGVELIYYTRHDDKYYNALQQEIEAYFQLGMKVPAPGFPAEVSCHSHFDRFTKMTPCPDKVDKRKMFLLGIRVGIDNRETISSVLYEIIELGDPELGLFDIEE